ncbi:MAG: glycosyltransferase family 4 protein [Pseudomonadota bacterium]
MILLATQCFPPRLGGIEGYMGGLADALAAAGSDVVVVADRAAEDAATEEDAADRLRPVAVTRVGGWKPLRARRKALRIAVRLRAAAAEGGVERIICDSWKSAETALRAIDSASIRPRLITLAHGMEFPAAPRPAKRDRIARALARVDRILANSDYTAARAAPFAPDPARIAVVPPPIPPQPEPSAAARAALRARLAAALGRAAPPTPLIACLARHEPRKGFDHVIDAAAAAREAHPSLGVAIAGDGPDRARLEGLAAARGAPVCFLGRVSEAEKAALFAEAALLAMPSRAEGDSVEGFGMVYLEAGWHGAPALAGRVGGAAAAVIEGETGWFCDGAAPEAVRAALAGALSDPAERARRGAAAADHARAQRWSARIAEFLSA